MSQYFVIHPDNPQKRLIHQSVRIVKEGGVIAYPTDSGYALGCHLGDRQSVDRIRRIRGLDAKHYFTLVCRDLSDVGTYARFDTPEYRLLKKSTPGPYTFILRATREVPRRLMNPMRKTVGLRVPDHPVTHALLEELNEPLLSTTLILPGDTISLNDASEIRERLEHEVDLVIDGGPCGTIPTTVVDLSDTVPHILRKGKGDVSPFE